MIIKINLDDVLDRIYAESAWHAAYNNKIKLLTPDNARMLEMRIEDALHELRSRISGYVCEWNYNPHISSGNITIGLTMKHQQPQHVQEAMHGAITELLAAYALMCFYGEEGTYYGTAWRLHRTKVLLLLARDQL